MKILVLTVYALSCCNGLLNAAEKYEGLIVHRLDSKYQSSATKIKVLLPDNIEKGRKYRVLYLLPVEKLDNTQFGNALEEVRDLNLHNRYKLICVYPTFTDWPWFADHPHNPKIRQETYFIKEVIPLIEDNYPVSKERKGRLLVGFSKSGWGAYSLLLRHPDLFEKAAAWDAPLCEGGVGQWGTTDIFANNENFTNYKISLLLPKCAPWLKKESRLVLMGHGNFQWHVEKTHASMAELGILHRYQAGPKREHRWDSGWLEDAVKFLTDEEN